MDPNANLSEQLRLASRLVYQSENDKRISESDSVRLAELVIALDEWIRRGGFIPTEWTLRR